MTLTAAKTTCVTNYVILRTTCNRSSVVPLSQRGKLRLEEAKQHVHEDTAYLT